MMECLLKIMTALIFFLCVEFSRVGLIVWVSVFKYRGDKKRRKEESYTVSVCVCVCVCVFSLQYMLQGCMLHI